MSNLSALTHEEKQFHKLMAQEAKADDMLIKIAEKEVKRAEKAYNKGVKVRTWSVTAYHIMTAKIQETEKAERDAAKATEAKAKTAKKLNKVEHTHKDAVVHCEQAEKKFEVRLSNPSLTLAAGR